MSNKIKEQEIHYSIKFLNGTREWIERTIQIQKDNPVLCEGLIYQIENLKTVEKEILEKHQEMVNFQDELVEALKLALKSMKECDERQHIKRHSSDPIFKAEKALSKAQGGDL